MHHHVDVIFVYAGTWVRVVRGRGRCWKSNVVFEEAEIFWVLFKMRRESLWIKKLGLIFGRAPLEQLLDQQFAVSSTPYLKASAEDSGSLLNGVISFATAAAFPPKVKSPWCKPLMSHQLWWQSNAVLVCPARPVRRFGANMTGTERHVKIHDRSHLFEIDSSNNTKIAYHTISHRIALLFVRFLLLLLCLLLLLFLFFSFFFIFFLSGLSRKRLSKQSSVSSLGMAFGYPYHCVHHQRHHMIVNATVKFLNTCVLESLAVDRQSTARYLNLSRNKRSRTQCLDAIRKLRSFFRTVRSAKVPSSKAICLVRTLQEWSGICAVLWWAVRQEVRGSFDDAVQRHLLDWDELDYAAQMRRNWGDHLWTWLKAACIGIHAEQPLRCA